MALQEKSHRHGLDSFQSLVRVGGRKTVCEGIEGLRANHPSTPGMGSQPRGTSGTCLSQESSSLLSLFQEWGQDF